MNSNDNSWFLSVKRKKLMASKISRENNYLGTLSLFSLSEMKLKLNYNVNRTAVKE